MKPLQAVAVGLAFLALGPASGDPGSFDPLPDPMGWLFVLVGLHGLRDTLDPARYPLLRGLGVLALLVSVALVFADVARWLDSDPSLGWAADLPRFGSFALLCHLLGRNALAARDTTGANWFGTAVLALVFVLVAPPLAFGGGLAPVGRAGEVTAQLAQLVLVALCLVFAGRRWAGARDAEPEPTAEGEAGPTR